MTALAETTVYEEEPQTQPKESRQDNMSLFGAPPHVVCQRCGHFAAKHYGYPGRHSEAPTCAQWLWPTKSGDVPQKCDCPLVASEIV